MSVANMGMFGGSTRKQLVVVAAVLSLLSKLAGLAAKARYHFDIDAAVHEARAAHVAHPTVRGRVAQEDRVMTVVMIGVFVIVGAFVVATLTVQMPETGDTEADNAISNFTTDLFGYFELFGIVILMIIIGLVVFYVRRMNR